MSTMPSQPSIMASAPGAKPSRLRTIPSPPGAPRAVCDPFDAPTCYDQSSSGKDEPVAPCAATYLASDAHLAQLACTAVTSPMSCVPACYFSGKTRRPRYLTPSA
jgi:hypothetical protein